MRLPSMFLCLTLSVLTQLVTRAEDSVSFQNVILITLDGLRTEEVFDGADARLMVKENGVDNPEELKREYWREKGKERRETLLPFLWQQCQSDSGWIAGDLTSDSQVTVSNGLYFSYPGYSELLCGHADPRINSNDKKYNENVTVLEWLNRMPELNGKVAAYGSWDVFPFIINDRRSAIPVNAGWQPLVTGEPARIAALNLVAEQIFHQWAGVRYDVLTASGAIEELRAKQPRVLFVALGETDDWAHEGRYDRYLLSARQNDTFIRMIWEAAQALPSHRDNTLYIVTTDHGRGDGREGWKSHGAKLPGSERIWVAAFGNGIGAQGIDRGGRFQQAQIASTLAACLGYDFSTHSEAIKPPLPFAKRSTPQ